MTSHVWQYTCTICKSVETLPISEFMAKHAHGIKQKDLPDCEIVKHHGGKKVSIKLPPAIKFYLKDKEDGDKRGRPIRIWITGTDYGYSTTVTN